MSWLSIRLRLNPLVRNKLPPDFVVKLASYVVMSLTDIPEFLVRVARFFRAVHDISTPVWMDFWSEIFSHDISDMK